MTRSVPTVPLGACLLGAGALFLLRPLAWFWRENGPYFYGWGVPLLAVFLFYERWHDRPLPSPPSAQKGFTTLCLIAAAWGTVCVALRLVLETEPGSRPFLWLAATLWIGAVLAWVGLLGGRPWLRHFAFPVLFFLVGVPWIFRGELAVVQGLMRVNAASVTDTLRLFGVAAESAGNTINLSTGQLGITEACSGIRSLQASLMMALFFGEFYRYGWRGRVALAASGVGLALAGNFARLLYLAWRGASLGVAAVETAHDSAGWTILAVTLAGLWIICLVTRPKSAPAFVRIKKISPRSRRSALAWALSVFLATVLAESTTQIWYGFRESSAPHASSWSVAWPVEAHSQILTESVSHDLHAETSSLANWRDAAGWRWEGLWLRYRAGAEGKVVFEAHNPGLCLPAAGWRPLPGSVAFDLRVHNVRLEVQAQSFATAGGTVHVFWIPYLNAGVRAEADRSGGVYGHTFSALLAGRFPWLDDVWRGCRRVQAESLELAVLGPFHLADADAAVQQLLPRMILPDAVAIPELASRSFVR